MSSSSQWVVDQRGNRIHTSAIVADDVALGSNNTIGPLSVVGGLGCRVTIGDDNSVGVGSVIGAPAESASGYPGSAHLDFVVYSAINPALSGEVRIGSKCVIRDKVTIHAGLGGTTSIGDLNYLHTGTHLDHDVTSGIGVVFAPGALSSGRVSFGDFSQIGLGACLHQGSHIGAFAMVGMNATVKGRVPEMSLHFGTPSRLRGVNAVRLARLGLNPHKISEVELLLRSTTVSQEDRQRRLSEMLETLLAVATTQALRAWGGET
ncbi:MAG: hypothetical protein RL072_1535 [Actinomycetota bacterium]|jgi:acyl-[acyl carrier protein]--UDP-N-acetylglucosamine O-acyltransferase